jgi:hypothetical protein
MQFSDPRLEFRRFDHPAMGAVGQNPPDDFFQPVHAEVNVERAVVIEGFVL